VQNHLSKTQIQELKNEALEKEQFFDFINRQGRFLSSVNQYETKEKRIADAIRYFSKDYR